MWRAIFLACGISLCILGAECMIVDKAVLAAKPGAEGVIGPPKAREVKPAEWAPWSLLSAGAVILLYSITIPRRMSSSS